MSKTLSRRQAREKAVQALFQLIPPLQDSHEGVEAPFVFEVMTPQAACDFALEAGNDPAEGFDLRDAYLERLVYGVTEMTDQLDERIRTYLADDWTLERLSRIDLVILRLAFYEILYVSDEDVPSKVAINEAVDLAKTFSDEKSKRFVNGVLARLIQDHQD